MIVINLLRWSPSAVLWAIQPEPMIVTGRTDLKSNDDIDHLHRNYFIRRLYESLRQDLHSSLERTYLLDRFKIREIQTQQKFLVKSVDGMELEANLNERIGLGYLADGLTGPDGGNTILMLMLDSAPEPWDVDAWKQRSKDAEGAAEIP